MKQYRHATNGKELDDFYLKPRNVSVSLDYPASITTVLLCVTVGLAACSGPPTSDHTPWNCWRSSSYFECGSIEDQDLNLLAWSQWHAQNRRTLSIAWSCGRAPAGYEGENTRDFVCRPVFSQAATAFDDETTPRFHCFGTDGDDPDYLPTHREPSWLLKPEVRRQLGSGWFLWLALQTEGDERRQLLAVAKDYKRRAHDRIERDIGKLQAHVRPSPTAINPERSRSSALATLKQFKEQTRKHLTPDETTAQVEAELRAWKQQP